MAGGAGSVCDDGWRRYRRSYRRWRHSGVQACRRPAVVLDDLELGVRLAADPAQPAPPGDWVDDAVGESQLVRERGAAVGHRRPAQQRHRDLRAEAGGQAQRVLHRVARRRVDRFSSPSSGSGSLKLGTGGTMPVSSALIATTSSMPAPMAWPVKPLVFVIDDLVRCGAERRPQRADLRGGAAAARRRVRLVRDEHGRPAPWRGGRSPRDSAWRDELLHHLADVRDVEARAVEGAVRGHRAQHLADRLDAALARGIGRFDDDRRRAHPDDHPVPATVERDRGLLDHVVGRGGTAGQEAAADPRQQRVAGDVVGRDDDDPARAAGADPVLGDAQCLGRARARRVHLGVRPARTDELGELRVAHGQARGRGTADRTRTARWRADAAVRRSAGRPRAVAASSPPIRERTA